MRFVELVGTSRLVSRAGWEVGGTYRVLEQGLRRGLA